MRKTLHLKLLLLLAMMLVGAGNVKAQEQEQSRAMTVEPTETTTDFWPKTGTLEVKAQNFTFDEVNSAHFWYYSPVSDIKLQTNYYDWVTLSLSEDNKTITYTLTGNTSNESRTANFELEFYFWEEGGLPSIFSNKFTITQTPSNGPILDISPDNVVLESNAKGIEGTMTTTTYNFSHDINLSDILWSKDYPYHEWIEVKYDDESKTITYKTIKENDDTDRSLTAKFQLLYGYRDNTGVYHNLHSDWVTVTQPAAPVLTVVPIDATIGYESQKTATMQISATDIDLNNAEFSRIKWLKNVQGDEISKPDWIDVSLSENKQAMTLTTLEKNETGQPRTANFKLFLKYNGEEICTDFLSVTQNPSTKPELTYTPSEMVSNAKDLTGTLIATVVDYQLSNLNYRIRWYSDATGQNENDQPDWIDIVGCSQDRKTFTYQTLEANESNQPRSAYLKIELYYPNDETDVISSNVVTITQPGEGTKITISPACTNGNNYYGTYSSSYPFMFPEGLTVAEVGIDSDGKLEIGTYGTDVVVPAKTGVMVYAAAPGDYVVTNVFDGEDYSSNTVLGFNNRLRPSGDEGITAADMAELDKDCKYYRLTMHNGEKIGFWWGASEGGAFNLAPNKAYLAVPDTDAAAMGFTFDGGEATAIEAIAKELGSAGKTVYNLHGQRVNAPTKGLYIVNGKKVVIK